MRENSPKLVSPPFCEGNKLSQMSKHKRGEQGSSSSSANSPLELKKVRTMEQDLDESVLKALIHNLSEKMETNFAKIHEELNVFRLDMKAELDGLNGKFKEMEKGIEEVWATINDLKEENAALKAVKVFQAKESQSLRQDLDKINQELTNIKEELKEERNNIVDLEDYTRRENLKFNNIPETTEDLTPKEVVCDILQGELQIDTSNIRFHAVYRIGKRKENKIRPIIARFVRREDRDLVFSKKKGLQHSRRFKDSYITTDYAKVIQAERRKLIKAMHKAKKKGDEAKVVGRWLHIGGQRYNSENIPEHLLNELDTAGNNEA